jgi:hypothetical protein
MKRQFEMIAEQAAQLALANAPKPAARPPAGMDPSFYSAMVSAGAKPMEAPQAPQQAAPSALPAPPQAQSSPILPPIGASIEQLPQQAPVMSQVSPAPRAPAMANINNNVTMPMPTFNPASQRPSLPTFNGPLTPNMGGYAPAPTVPGYGMPRQGQPFRPATPPSLPTFATFSGMPAFGGQQTQPFGQAEPDMGMNIMARQPNLFNQYR